MPGASVRIVDEDTGATAREITAVSDEQGAYRAAALSPGKYKVEASLDGFDTAERRIVLGAGQAAVIDVTLSPARFSQSVVVTARRVEELAQDVPIPVSVIRGRPRGRRRRLQRQPSERADPDGPVLFDQPAQLRDQHPRPRRAVRAHQRRPRARRRASTSTACSTPARHRRRSTSSTSTRSRCCADRRARSSARTRPPARSTSRPASPASRGAPSSRLNYGNLQFVQAKASITGPLDEEPGRAGLFLRHAARRHDRQRQDPGAHQHAEQPRPQGPVALRAVGRARSHAGARRHAPAPRRLHAGGRGVAPTLRPPNRQYPQIAAELGYTPPSFNAFDRMTDVDSPLRSYQDLGGASLNVDWKLGPGRLNVDHGVALLELGSRRAIATSSACR